MTPTNKKKLRKATVIFGILFLLIFVGIATTFQNCSYTSFGTAFSKRSNLGPSEPSGISATLLPSGSQFRRIAGDVNPGFNTVSSNLLIPIYPMSWPLGQDVDGIQVDSNGDVYFRVHKIGIFRIRNGISDILIKSTGISTGDGGPVSEATLNNAVKIALDGRTGLLVYDSDRIRRIDFGKQTIELLVGGGQNSSDGARPKEFKMPIIDNEYNVQNITTFFGTPNGHIFFTLGGTRTPASGFRVFVYLGANLPLVALKPAGVGAADLPALDISHSDVVSMALSFNPAITDSTKGSLTSVLMFSRHPIVGDSGAAATRFEVPNYTGAQGVLEMTPMAPHPAGSFAQYGPQKLWDPSDRTGFFTAPTGRLYAFSLTSEKIFEFDVTANSWNLLAGTGVSGYCAEGTLAKACGMNPTAIAVSPQGMVYFLDKGRLRYIDSDGLVQTFSGFPGKDGDGGLASENRLGKVEVLDFTGPDTVAFIDSANRKIREFKIDGEITTLAGNGQDGMPTLGTLATRQPLSTDGYGFTVDLFRADFATGNIYFDLGRSVGMLNRVTGNWELVIGGGNVSMGAADGNALGNIAFSMYYPFIIGNNGQDLLVAHYDWTPTPPAGGTSERDGLMKEYSLGPVGKQLPFAGFVGNYSSSADFCDDKTPLSQCSFPYQALSMANADNVAGRWLLLKMGTNFIRAARYRPLATEFLQKFAQLNHGAVSFAYAKKNDQENIYYCSAEDGEIYQKTLSKSLEVLLSTGKGTPKCTGRSLLYSPSRRSLIYPGIENGLYGIYELTLN